MRLCIYCIYIYTCTPGKPKTPLLIHNFHEIPTLICLKDPVPSTRSPWVMERRDAHFGVNEEFYAEFHWVWPPPRMPVTTRFIIYIIFVVGDPYKSSFGTVTGRGNTQVMHVTPWRING